MQSSLQSQEATWPRPPLHVAIIMDGNGRWAAARGLPREAGHRAGVTALRNVVEAAPALGVTTLSAYAFSQDNWRRPAEEVSTLMALLRGYLATEIARLADADVRLTVLGRRDRLPDGIPDLIARAEAATVDGARLDLRLAVDYSGRDAILAAVSAVAAGAATCEDVSRQLERHGGGPGIDLLIRTSGEQRLSDFMLWEAAYAELYFVDTFWPDFNGAALARALAAFRARERRFGGRPQDATAAGKPPRRSLAAHIKTLLAGSAR
jgi:undecaprenyl diphosphate synthase